MNTTKIEWTDFSANPLKYRNRAGKTVWACVKVSPGCAHCYACEIGHRYQRGGDFTAAEMADLDPFLDDKELRKMLTAKVVDGLPTAGAKCFPFDMTDLFGDWVPQELIDRCFAVFALRQDMTFQVLTKRAERLKAYMDHPDREARWMNATAWALEHFKLLDTRPEILARREPWLPLPNVWLGVSVENQKYADERIALLLQTPAAVRFVSYEPALGPIDLESVQWPEKGAHRVDVLRAGYWNREGYKFGAPSAELGAPRGGFTNHGDMERLDWVIVGGESGPGARPFAEDWARATVTTCQQAGVAVFVKQMGSQLYTQYNTDSKGVFIGGCTDLSGRKTKGNDMAEWPADLRVRQFPEVRR